MSLWIVSHDSGTPFMTWLDLTITLLHELVNLQLQDVLMSALILECCVGLGFFLFVSGLGLVGFFFSK